MSTTTIVELLPLSIDADGVFRVGGTRVTLDTIVTAYEQGLTPEEIVQRYSTLQLADVYAVVGYYLRKHNHVAEYLRKRQQHSQSIRQENLARSQQQTIRARLLARQELLN